MLRTGVVRTMRARRMSLQVFFVVVTSGMTNALRKRRRPIRAARCLRISAILAASCGCFCKAHSSNASFRNSPLLFFLLPPKRRPQIWLSSMGIFSGKLQVPFPIGFVDGLILNLVRDLLLCFCVLRCRSGFVKAIYSFAARGGTVSLDTLGDVGLFGFQPGFDGFLCRGSHRVNGFAVPVDHHRRCEFNALVQC